MKDIKRRVLDDLDKAVNDAKEKIGKAKTLAGARTIYLPTRINGHKKFHCLK